MRIASRPIAVLSFCLLALCLRAEEGAGKTMLWKVTSDTGGEAYLLGSVHVMKKEIYPLPKVMEEAFARSKFLVLEVDESKLDAAKVQKLMMEKGMYAAGDGLSKHIPKELQEKLQAFLTKCGIPAAMAEKMKPWTLSITLTMTSMMKLGYDPEFDIDKHFLKQANADGKKVLELETAEAQLEMLSGLSDELQQKMLGVTLEELESKSTDIEDMIAAWSAGDAAKLDTVLHKQVVKHPEFKPFFEKMFDERNIGMTGKVEEYLKTKDIHFVVAGAGHMVGEKGIVSLLQKKKYKVEQISKAEVRDPEPAGAK